MSEQDQEFKISQCTKEDNAQLHSVLRLKIRDDRDKSIAQYEEYPPNEIPREVLSFVDPLKDWMHEFLKNHGAEPSETLKEMGFRFINIASNSESSEHFFPAAVVSGYPCIDIKAIQNRFQGKNISNFVIACLMVEELFHASGTQFWSYHYIHSDTTKVYEYIDRSGVSYGGKGNHDGNWLEEGLAAYIVHQAVETIIKDQFPDSYEQYKNQLPIRASWDNRYYSYQYSVDNISSIVAESPYSSAYQAVSKLIIQIPEFLETALKVRTSKSSLPLARVIKQYYPNCDFRGLMRLEAIDREFELKLKQSLSDENLLRK